jgi:hypothetical protein
MKDLLGRLEEARKISPAYVKNEMSIISQMLRGVTDFIDFNKAEAVGSLGASLSRLSKVIAAFGGKGFKTAAKHVDKAVDALVDAVDSEGWASAGPSEGLEEAKGSFDATVKKIARMTDRNDHGGAMEEAAKLIGDKESAKRFNLINQIHDLDGSIDGDLSKYRYKAYRWMKDEAEKKLSSEDFEKLMSAL